MIEIPTNNNHVMAVYHGRPVRAYSSSPGDGKVIIEENKVDMEALDELFKERMLFDWSSEPFLLMKYQDGLAFGLLLSHNEIWAIEHGLSGDRSTGWTRRIPEAEIENVRVERSDVLAAWRYQNETGSRPPSGLYTEVRAATPEEWTRG